MNDSNAALEAVTRQNPFALNQSEAQALIRAESGGMLDAVPPGVTKLDSPAGVFFDKGSVIAAARCATGLAAYDASRVPGPLVAGLHGTGK